MEIERAPQQPQIPEVLTKKWGYLVVDPYSENVHVPPGSSAEDLRERLSFYSAFTINTAYEMWRRGQIDKIVLFGDASFGSAKKPNGQDFKSTGQLEKEFLMRDHGEGRPAVPGDDIILFDDPNMNQTATQLRRLQQAGIGKTDPALYLSWDYHIPRIENHAKGFGVNVKMVGAEAMWEEINPGFDMDKLMLALDTKAMYGKEKPREILSRFFNKDFPWTMLKGPEDGAVVDIEKLGERVVGQPREIRHIIVPGKQKLTEASASK